jgi:hypothetical protein
MTQSRGMEILRFEHASYVLEQPMTITSSGTKSMWTFMDGHYRPLFVIDDESFGPFAELAHAKYWVPKMLETPKTVETESDRTNITLLRSLIVAG